MGSTSDEEAVADAAPGVFVQNRDCGQGVGDVVMPIDAVRIAVKEAKGSSGCSRVVRGKNQGAISGAVRAKPRGPVGVKE